MKELYCQLTSDFRLVPVSDENKETLKHFKPNQIVRIQVYGTRKARSVLQNRWIHAIFRLTAENAKDESWDTVEKVKRNVKMAMKFFKDDVTVIGNRVYFELRSFAFDKMEQHEADVRYNEAKLICAQYLGVRPETLEAEAIKDAT